MKIFCIVIFSALFISSNGQDKNKTSVLNFRSSQKMIVYLDSSGHFEMTECWENIESAILVDVTSKNLILITSTTPDIFLSVKKKSAYKLPFSTLISYSGVNKKNGNCGIRLSLPNEENLYTYYTVLYIDYPDVTYVYRMLAEK